MSGRRDECGDLLTLHQPRCMTVESTGAAGERAHRAGELKKVQFVIFFPNSRTPSFGFRYVYKKKRKEKR